MSTTDRGGRAGPPSPPPDSRFRNCCLALLLTLVAIAFAKFAASLLIPLASALVLTVLLRPAVRRLEALRMGSLLASALVIFWIMAVPLVVGIQIAPAAMHWLDRAPVALRRAEVLLGHAGGPLEQLNAASRQVDRLAHAADGASLSIPVSITGSPDSEAFTDRIGPWVFSLTTTLLILSFMLCYGERALRAATATIASTSRRRRAQVTLRRLERDLGRYLTTVTAINFCLGVVQTLALSACGMPNALLWGCLCAVLNFIPYLGSVVGTVLVGLAALLSFGPVPWAALPPSLYFLITAIEGYVITPLILGASLRINPLLVILAITFWAWLWGLPGAMLAVPLLAACMIVAERLTGCAPLIRSLGGLPPRRRCASGTRTAATTNITAV
ncbi:MAG: AI-2E family transporter [Planctomycetota bacterium]|nr:AI-2E family transporter [Planctomycetota bacterium]